MSETQADSKQQVEETKQGEKPQKKYYENKRQGGQQGGDRSKKVYVEKGKEYQEGAAEGEETQTKKHYYKNQEGGFRHKHPQDKKRIQVTLETVIPEAPKKADRLKEPDDTDYKATLDKIDTEIKKKWDDFRKFKDDLRKEQQTLRQQDKQQIYNDKTPILETLKEKTKLRKQLFDEASQFRNTFNEVRKQLEDYYTKSQKYRQKMKKMMKKDQIIERLKELQEKQQHGNISIQEEKQVIKEISDLQVSLQYAGPLDQLNEQFEGVKQQRDEIYKKMQKKYEEAQKAKEEEDRLSDEFEKIRGIQKEKNEQNKNDSYAPLIDRKEEETKQEVDEMKAKKRELKDKHFEAWKSYEEQQQLVRDIEFMQKIQKRLKRDAEQKKYEDEEKKAQEEEQKEINENIFKEQIDLCQLLIEYCENLKPQKKKEEVVEKKQQVNIDEVLKSDVWKKDNVTMIKSKKEQNNDLFTGKSKKGKKQPNKQNTDQNQEQEQKKTEESINHKIDVLGFFDTMKVMPPLWVSQLDNTIKLLNEKKEYFTNQPKDQPAAEKKQEEGGVQPSTDAAQENKEQQNKAQKKQHQTAYEGGEEDFPSLENQQQNQ